MSAYTILVVIALLLSVASIIKPAWPLLPVAVILISVAMLISRS